MERRHEWVIVASVRGERARPYFGEGDAGQGESSLVQAMRRASQIAPSSHITPVVLDEHRPWWAPLLRDLPKQNLVIEPFDRGTACGILLAVVRLLRRDPKACVAILSADADASDLEVAHAYRSALDLANRHDACAAATRDGSIARVEWLPAGEVELIVGSVQHLIALFQETQPKLLQTYLRDLHGPALFSDDALDTLYPFLPEVALTTGVLEKVRPRTPALAPMAEARRAVI